MGMQLLTLPARNVTTKIRLWVFSALKETKCMTQMTALVPWIIHLRIFSTSRVMLGNNVGKPANVKPWIATLLSGHHTIRVYNKILTL